MQQPITKTWCAENPERCHELAQPPERCPICMEAFTDGNPANCPLLGDSASRHWACTECWLNIMDDDNWRCPWCREGLQKRLGRGRGRALSPRERWRKKRLCQEAWKLRRRGAYLAQKRELAHRPEYLAKRRALYAQKRAAKRPSMGDSA